MFLTYSFVVSAAAVFVLLAAKLHGVRKGRETFVTRLLSKADPFFFAIAKRGQAFLHHHGERTFFLFLVHIPSRAEAFFARLKAKTHEYYHDAHSRMRAKRNMAESSVSPYLRSMSLNREGNNRVF